LSRAVSADPRLKSLRTVAMMEVWSKGYGGPFLSGRGGGAYAAAGGNIRRDDHGRHADAVGIEAVAVLIVVVGSTAAGGGM